MPNGTHTVPRVLELSIGFAKSFVTRHALNDVGNRVAFRLLDTFQLLDTFSVNNAVTEDKETLLHLVARKNRRKLADYLVRCGADVDASRFDGITPLHLAALHGNPVMVKMLLKERANVNARTAARFWRNHLETVKVFGQDASAGRTDGMTPLHIAAWKGKPEIVKRLLKRGAHIDHQDAAGRTPLHFAVLTGTRI